MGKLASLSGRGTVPIYEKVEKKPEGSHLVKHKKEVLYKYYKCDYCGDEIKIVKKRQDMTGGIVIMPSTLTKRIEETKLVLCNKCLKPALKEFEEV